MSAVNLVLSDIVHIRHGGAHHPAGHVLRRKGLSLWLDLDQLDAAALQRVPLPLAVDPACAGPRLRDNRQY